MKYYIINSQFDARYCYSGEQLSKILLEKLNGKTLENIYISALSDASKSGEQLNCYDSRPIYLVFDSIVLVLTVYAEGLLKYDFIPRDNLTVTPSDIKEKDLFSLYNTKEAETVYFDISEMLTSAYDGAVLTARAVTTNTYAFSPLGFDKELASISAAKNQLPSGISLITADNNEILITGDTVEYFNITISNVVF